MHDTINPTEALERLAVAMDSTPSSFDATAAQWLTTIARSCGTSDVLVAIMNDPAETEAVRSRAMTMLTADLLRS